MTATLRRIRRAGTVVLVATLAALTVLTPSSLAETGDDTSVTVAAPEAGYQGSTASVTVSQTTDLVNQTLHVSWTGFRPSSSPVVSPALTKYVVRVYQCRGDAPASPADCYGSSKYTYPDQSDTTAVLPDGPGNAVDAATAPDGTGSVDIEVRTILESTTLACTATADCSIVVVPNYGTGHGGDFAYATTDHMDDDFAWKRHVAIPLHMAAVGAICPLGIPGVITEGSPMLQRAITSWQPSACKAAHPVNADYTALGEPLARDDYIAGNADLALTTLPGDTTRPTVYAPLSVSGVTVAFHVDDAQTGQPITDMKLNARLVAKLITESYGGVGVTAPGATPGPKSNPSVVGNPYSIYTDPEFLALNPGHHWPLTNPTNPLLLAGNSDLTWELTRWIDDDPTARAWLDGTVDPYGMHVNTHYKGIDYPAMSLDTKDPYVPFSYTFVPINGLDHVARGLVTNQPSSSNPDEDPITHQHVKDPAQAAGKRGLIAIIDTADAAAFRFPEASLVNAAGVAVTPTTASLAAAVTYMTTDPKTGTALADHLTTDAAAYPMAMVQYAMAPTGDLTGDKADQVARFLDYAAGPGQQPGTHTGQLPGGYLPLPTDLLSKLTAAAVAVRSQSGKPPPVVAPTTGGTGTSAPDTGYSDGQVGGTGTDVVPDAPDAPSVPDAPAAVAAPGVPRSAATTAAPATSALAASERDGVSLRLWWPVLLIATAVAGLVGPLLLAHGSGVFASLTPSRYRGRRSA